MTWPVAPNIAESRLADADKRAHRHWLFDGRCWCGLRHRAGEAFTLTAPPWDESRRVGSAAAS